MAVSGALWGSLSRMLEWDSLVQFPYISLGLALIVPLPTVGKGCLHQDSEMGEKGGRKRRVGACDVPLH